QIPGIEYYDQLDRLQFHYPHYESPFRVSINANFSYWMDSYCCQWAINTSGPMRMNSRYVSSIRNSDLGFFSAVTFPTANWHRMEKLMKWCMMFFIVDDYHDIVTQQSKDNKQINCNYFWQHMIDMLNGLEHNQCLNSDEWPDFIKGIQSVLSEMYFDYNDVQIRRSVRMIKDYIDGNVLETEWFDDDDDDENVNNENDIEKRKKADKEELPDWDTYMKARLGSVGGQMSLQLIEYAKEVSLTDDQFNHTLMHRLERAVSEEMTLVNDYLTFRKEVAENDFRFSKMRHAFPVLVNQGFTLQESVNRVHQMIMDKDRLIFRLMNRIMAEPSLNVDPSASAQLRLFLEGVDEFVGGYWRHAVTARRYHGLNFKGAIPPEGHFRYDPNMTVIVSSTLYRYRWLSDIPNNVQPNIEWVGSGRRDNTINEKRT
ncbi:hypothetical protein BLOT_000537, partial [Blomia tropicalis]